MSVSNLDMAPTLFSTNGGGEHLNSFMETGKGPLPSLDPLSTEKSSTGSPIQENLPWKQIESQLHDGKVKLSAMLSAHHFDEALLLGLLSFTQSKCTAFIHDEFKTNTSINSGSGSIKLAQSNNNKLNATDVIDKIWMDIHHPAIKGFQRQFQHISRHASSNTSRGSHSHGHGHGHGHGHRSKSSSNSSEFGSSTSVEYRKLFEKFVKFISKSYEFYFDLVEGLINKYDLTSFIAIKKLTNTLKLTIAPNSELIKLTDLHFVAQLVYFIHKCTLYIGDLSRYRTFIAKNYLPTNSISKEDNNNYSKSIELYKLSLLILPSLGDPYNHVAIIDNFKDDRFNVVYNFMRSCLTSKPLPIGLSNLITYLLKGMEPKSSTSSSTNTPTIYQENSILVKNFEKYNSIDRANITKIEKFELIKYQFLCLFSVNLLPKYWKVKDNYIPRYYNIEKIILDHFNLISKLDFHKQIFNDFYFKKLVILIGGFELLIDNHTSKNPQLDNSKEVLSSYLNAIFCSLTNVLKISLGNYEESSAKDSNLSGLLLPLLRLILCWFNERKLALGYVSQTYQFSALLSTLLNRLFQYVVDNNIEIMEAYSTTFNLKLKLNNQAEINKFFDKSPSRKRLFKEDVMMREFKPIGHRFKDFNDDHLYQNNEESILGLIGELPNSGSDSNEPQYDQKNLKKIENFDRLFAICYLGKKLVIENNKVGITFNETTGLFEGLAKFEKSRKSLAEEFEDVEVPVSEYEGDAINTGPHSNANGRRGGKINLGARSSISSGSRSKSVNGGKKVMEKKNNQGSNESNNGNNNNKGSSKKTTSTANNLHASESKSDSAGFANMIANMVDSLVDDDHNGVTTTNDKDDRGFQGVTLNANNSEYSLGSPSRHSISSQTPASAGTAAEPNQGVPNIAPNYQDFFAGFSNYNTLPYSNNSTVPPTANLNQQSNFFYNPSDQFGVFGGPFSQFNGVNYSAASNASPGNSNLGSLMGQSMAGPGQLSNSFMNETSNTTNMNNNYMNMGNLGMNMNSMMPSNLDWFNQAPNQKLQSGTQLPSTDSTTTPNSYPNPYNQYQNQANFGFNLNSNVSNGSVKEERKNSNVQW